MTVPCADESPVTDLLALGQAKSGCYLSWGDGKALGPRDGRKMVEYDMLTTRNLQRRLAVMPAREREMKIAPEGCRMMIVSLLSHSMLASLNDLPCTLG